jgi:hypothetical protein
LLPLLWTTSTKNLGLPQTACGYAGLVRLLQDFVWFDFASGQVGDQLAVGGQEIVIGEFLWQCPGDVFVDDGRDVGLGKLCGEKVNLELRGEVGVLMKDFSNFAALGQCDAKFFAQFARQRLLKGFPIVDFATRKFPFERRSVVVTALPDEEASIGAFDDSGYNNHEVITRKKHNRVANGTAFS